MKIKTKQMIKKFKIKLDDEFKNCKLTIPAMVPITQNFDKTRILGHAEVIPWGSDLFAYTPDDIENVNIGGKEQLKDLINKENLSLAIGGIVTKREDNIIHEFKITEVSIIPNIQNITS